MMCETSSLILSSAIPPAALFTVSGVPGASGKCLEIRDGPDQTPTFEPHFYFDPSHHNGETRVSFDLRVEEDYRFLHEWRDAANPYNNSVFLSVEKGVLTAGGKRLTSFPPLSWVHFEIKSRIGESADGTWAVTVTPAGSTPQTFEKLPPQKKALKELRWLGFISPGTKPAKGWLDNLQIQNNETR